MTPIHRTVPALVLLGALASGAAGCGSDQNSKEDGVAKVSGNCALMKDKYELSPISAELLDRTLGDGTYRLSGNVSGAGTADDPLNGRCSYDSVDEDGKVTGRLELSVNSKDMPYSDYQKQVDILQRGDGITRIPGVQGYVKVEDDTALGGGAGEGGSGVIIDGDMVYGATIVVPGKGIDGAKACEDLVKAAAEAFSKPLPLKQ